MTGKQSSLQSEKKQKTLISIIGKQLNIKSHNRFILTLSQKICIPGNYKTISLN